MRVHTERMKKIKNDSASKITYLFRKNYLNKHNLKILGKTSEMWLKQNKISLSSLPFSYKNREKAAIKIQRKFRIYKKRQMVNILIFNLE